MAAAAAVPIAVQAAPYVVAGVAALSQVLGARKAAKSNKQASGLQYQTQQEALAFEREREATRKAEYDRDRALQEAQWNAREQRKEEILARYGRAYSRRPYAGAITATPTSRAQAAHASVAPAVSLAMSSREPMTPALVPPRIPWGYA